MRMCKKKLETVIKCWKIYDNGNRIFDSVLSGKKVLLFWSNLFSVTDGNYIKAFCFTLHTKLNIKVAEGILENVSACE